MSGKIYKVVGTLFCAAETVALLYIPFNKGTPPFWAVVVNYIILFPVIAMFWALLAAHWHDWDD